MGTNFKSWLVEQKRIWKEKKTEHNETMRTGDMKSILQIIPDKIPGSFSVWYWAGGRVQQMSMTMKRKYYSNRRGGTKKAPREEG